jgi:ribonuclease-3
LRPQPIGTRLLESLRDYPVSDDMLRQALSHRSYCSEWGGLPSNERLELLGDAVLGLVVADHLYRSYPDLPEGDLARLRASVVSTQALAPVAAEIGVGEAVLLGKGEEASGGRAKDSILADCLEAIIAAVYLSLGLSGATAFVVNLLEDPIAGIAAGGRLGDPKNRLQELAAHLNLSQPTYKVSDKGPDHAKVFFAEVTVGTDVVGRGTGSSKKIAERLAAAAALEVISSGGTEESSA